MTLDDMSLILLVCAYIGMYFFGCLLHEDDILLVSHSIFDMQLMLDICSQEADTLDFTFNTSMSVTIRIGESALLLCIFVHLSRVDQVKYLGMLLLSAHVFKCSFDQLKMKFYQCFNAIYHKACNANSELVCVELMKSVCW